MSWEGGANGKKADTVHSGQRLSLQSTLQNPEQTTVCKQCLLCIITLVLDVALRASVTQCTIASVLICLLICHSADGAIQVAADDRKPERKTHHSLERFLQPSNWQFLFMTTISKFMKNTDVIPALLFLFKSVNITFPPLTAQKRNGFWKSISENEAPDKCWSLHDCFPHTALYVEQVEQPMWKNNRVACVKLSS